VLAGAGSEGESGMWLKNTSSESNRERVLPTRVEALHLYIRNLAVSTEPRIPSAVSGASRILATLT